MIQIKNSRAFRCLTCDWLRLQKLCLLLLLRYCTTRMEEPTSMYPTVLITFHCFSQSMLLLTLPMERKVMPKGLEWFLPDFLVTTQSTHLVQHIIAQIIQTALSLREPSSTTLASKNAQSSLWNTVTLLISRDNAGVPPTLSPTS